VSRIILRSRAAQSLPALEPEELVITLSAWTEILGGAVPENDLEPAYIRAMQDKENTFALGASEIVKAYRANCASERAAPRKPQTINLLEGEVCQRCFGSGWELVRKNGYDEARECGHRP
jgi:hypothetical protein